MITFTSVGAIWIDAKNAESANRKLDKVLDYARRHGVDITADTLLERED